jgi:aminoglycoside phosphotransferase (APT) family kinase protein
VVHGDYRLDNCIVASGRPRRIAAVLDWELSTLGDPLTDVGMLQFYWSDAPVIIPSIVPAVTTGAGFASAHEMAARWSARTGICVEGIRWYRAFAHFKFAVIAAGVAARVRAGAMGGQSFGDLHAEIAAVAQAGLERLHA